MTRPILSLNAPFPARFPRMHTGSAPEPLQPLTSWTHELLRLGGIVILMALLWAFAAVLA